MHVSSSGSHMTYAMTEDAIKQTKNVGRLQEMCIMLLKENVDYSQKIKAKSKAPSVNHALTLKSDSNISILQYKLSAYDFYRNILERNLQLLESVLIAACKDNKNIILPKTDVVNILKINKENITKMKNLHESSEGSAPSSPERPIAPERRKLIAVSPPSRKRELHEPTARITDNIKNSNAPHQPKFAKVRVQPSKSSLVETRSNPEFPFIQKQDSEIKFKNTKNQSGNSSSRNSSRPPSVNNREFKHLSAPSSAFRSKSARKQSNAELESEFIGKIQENRELQKDVYQANEDYKSCKMVLRVKREELMKEIEENKKLKTIINEKMENFQTKITIITTDIEKLRATNRDLRNKLNEIDYSIQKGLEQIEVKRKQLEDAVHDKENRLDQKYQQLQNTNSKSEIISRRLETDARSDVDRRLKTSQTSPVSLTIDGLLQNMEIEKHNVTGSRKYSFDDALSHLQQFIEDDDDSDGNYDMPEKSTVQFHNLDLPSVRPSPPMRRLPTNSGEYLDDQEIPIKSKQSIPALPKKEPSIRFSQESGSLPKSITQYIESDTSNDFDSSVSSNACHAPIKEIQSSRELPKFSLIEDPKYLNEPSPAAGTTQGGTPKKVTIAKPFVPIKRHGSYLSLSGSDFLGFKKELSAPRPLAITPPQKLKALKDESEDSENEFSDLPNASRSPKACLSLSASFPSPRGSFDSPKNRSPSPAKNQIYAKVPNSPLAQQVSPFSQSNSKNTKQSDSDRPPRRFSNNSNDEDDLYIQKPREYKPPTPSNDPNLLKHAEGDFVIVDNFGNDNDETPISIKPVGRSNPINSNVSPQNPARIPSRRNTKMARRASTLDITPYLEADPAQEKAQNSWVVPTPVSVEDNPVDLTKLIEMIPDEVRKGPRDEIVFDDTHKFDYDNLVSQLQKHNTVMSAKFEGPPKDMASTELIELFDGL